MRRCAPANPPGKDDARKGMDMRQDAMLHFFFALLFSGLLLGGSGCGTFRPPAAAGAVQKSGPAAVAPAPEAERILAPLSPGKGSYRTVRRGDTVARIARETGSPASAIIRANRLGDGSRILPGQRLWIPLAGTSSNDPEESGGSEADDGDKKNGGSE
jgi:hypothetical protein